MVHDLAFGMNSLGRDNELFYSSRPPCLDEVLNNLDFRHQTGENIKDSL